MFSPKKKKKKPQTNPEQEQGYPNLNKFSHTSLKQT